MAIVRSCQHSALSLTVGFEEAIYLSQSSHPAHSVSARPHMSDGWAILTRTCSDQLRLRPEASVSTTLTDADPMRAGQLTQQVAELHRLLLQLGRCRKSCDIGGCGHNLGAIVVIRALTKGIGCFFAKGVCVKDGEEGAVTGLSIVLNKSLRGGRSSQAGPGPVARGRGG